MITQDVQQNTKQAQNNNYTILYNNQYKPVHHTLLYKLMSNRLYSKFIILLLFIILLTSIKTALIVTTSSSSSSGSALSLPSSSSGYSSSANPLSLGSSVSSFYNMFRCYGNFINIGYRCVPCLNDQIAQNGRCVKLMGWGYGSNLIQTNTAYVPGLPNCVKAVNGVCSQCGKNYDVVMGKCVEQSCKIYSQLLGKCVDDLKPQQIQSLISSSPNSNTNSNTNSNSKSTQLPPKQQAQQIYIVGGPMSKMQIILVDNVIALSLPTLALKFDDKTLQITQISTESSPQNINNINNKNNVLFNNNNNVYQCVNYSNNNSNQCIQCANGFLVNLLANLCIEITPCIKFKHIDNNSNNNISNSSNSNGNN